MSTALAFTMPPPVSPNGETGNALGARIDFAQQQLARIATQRAQHEAAAHAAQTQVQAAQAALARLDAEAKEHKAAMDEAANRLLALVGDMVHARAVPPAPVAAPPNPRRVNKAAKRARKAARKAAKTAQAPARQSAQVTPPQAPRAQTTSQFDVAIFAAVQRGPRRRPEVAMEVASRTLGSDGRDAKQRVTSRIAGLIAQERLCMVGLGQGSALNVIGLPEHKATAEALFAQLQAEAAAKNATAAELRKAS